MRRAALIAPLALLLLGADPQGDPYEGMILIPAGPFVMGADDQGEPDERPAHTVTLKAFYIDRFEVTYGDYMACVKARACKAPRHIEARFEEPDRPVVGVDWWNAQAYCQWRGKRLLTEAEWEKAARGPEGRTYPWGDDPPSPERGCFDWQENRPCKPGSRPAGDSPYGVADMAGGVWEWVADVYDASYYPRSPAQDPTGGTCAESLAFFDKLRRERKQGFTGSNPIPTECERVLRGGAWNYAPGGLRSSNRVHHAPRFRIQVAGVRCGADAP
jgi:formylglycine-generating enzyme required for sulfatase activity